MKLPKINFYDVHLYKDKIEAFIKTGIWIISFIGGILALSNSQNKEFVGSSFFIYTLSLLMEFVPQIKEKAELSSRILHLIFCALLSTDCFLSIGILFGVFSSDKYSKLMHIFIILAIIYMLIDLAALWIQPEKKAPINKSSSIHIGTYRDEVIKKFRKKLLDGNLGSIKEGAEKNE